MKSEHITPSVPRPPHDPTWWLLNARIGWHEADLQHVEKQPPTHMLALAPQSGRGRSLTEASGSFGGLTVPSNVSLDPDGSIYLLDLKTVELKRFDPCECLFQTVPCFGGTGRGPRQLYDPHGIGIYGNNLFVCDTGNHRLSIFSLHGFVLRAMWRPPSTAGLTNDWEPYAVAFDRRGHVYVTDGANGYIHHFNCSGRWLDPLPGFGKATHITSDCRDSLYVVVEGTMDSVRVVAGDGADLGAVSRPEALGENFPRLPFRVDPGGHLHLENWCHQPRSSCCNKPAQATPSGIFDRHGQPVKDVPIPTDPIYEPEGVYIAGPLDSRLYQCQWHRIILKGRVPIGTRTHVATYTAETIQPIAHILDVREDVWETDQTACQLDNGEWDCLVRSGGGRYLWLRLQFQGNGFDTPAIESIRIEFPRISLRRYLPAVFGQDPVSADFTDRFLAIFDTTLRSVEQTVDQQAGFFDPLATPADSVADSGVDFLTWLAAWIGLTLDRHWPETKRRQFLRRAARLYHIRGTRTGLWRQLLFYLGFEPEMVCCAYDQPKTRCIPRPLNCAPVEILPCAWQPPPLILEHYQLRRWLFLGAGRVGDQAVLWGQRIVNRSQLDEGARLDQTRLKTSQDPYRDAFHVYAHKFSVFVPAWYRCSERHRKGLENLINTEKPAHTRVQIEYVAPRFRVGVQSMIGLDAVIGRYPEDVILDDTTLGWASVLSESTYQRGGPSLQVGVQARIGSTTKLD